MRLAELFFFFVCIPIVMRDSVWGVVWMQMQTHAAKRGIYGNKYHGVVENVIYE